MARILVTGAAGFIGSHVVDRLLQDEHEVIGLDSFDPFYPRALKERNLEGARSRPGFHLIEGDIRDESTVHLVFERYRPERVIHLAARAGVRPSIQEPETYITTNLTGTLNLLRASGQISVSHFLFASSSSVYGDTTCVPFSEEDRTDTPASPYAATKKAGEVLCFTYHQLLHLPVTCLRFFTVFGPRQRPDLAIHRFVRLIERGQPLPFYGDGSTSRDYTYVEDTVNGIIAALARPSGYEIYNLGRSDPVPLSELVSLIEQATGKRAVLDRRPEQPGDVRTTYADIAKAREHLGYEPRTPLLEGLHRFVEWWRANPEAQEFHG